MNLITIFRASESIFFVVLSSGSCSGSFHGVYLFVVLLFCKISEAIQMNNVPHLDLINNRQEYQQTKLPQAELTIK